MNRDKEHLQLLAVFHYVVAGLTALFALIPLIHVAIGWFMLHAPPPKHGEAPPPFIGWIFIIIGSCFIFAGESFAADNCGFTGIGQPCTRTELYGDTTFNPSNKLTNVSNLPEGAYFLFAAGKIRGCHGGPGRAIALY